MKRGALPAPRKKPPRKSAAPPPLIARYSSAQNPASAPPASARSIGSAPAPAPRPVHNVRSRLSPHCSRLRRARHSGAAIRRRRAAARLGVPFGAVLVFPMPLLLQRIGDILGHVIFVVFGKHGIGLEHARGVEPAFRHDALPFSKEVRK